MTYLTKDEARSFFGALYDGPGGGDPVDRGDFYELATRFVAKSDGQTVVGPTALQGLMLAYAMGHGQSGGNGPNAIYLAHISRPGVGAFARAYEGVTAADLIRDAKAAGFEAEIIG